MKHFHRHLAWVAVLAMTAGVSADYDEGIDGDLSDDPTTPTPIAFALGDNLVSGSVANSNAAPTGGDIDFLTFTIGAGQELSSLFLLEQSPSNRAFHAINIGSEGIVPSGPNAGDPTGYLGSDHLDDLGASVDQLPGLGNAFGGTAGSGFSGPLGPGTYSYIIQQTGDFTQGYTLNFVVTPEPGTLSLIALGVLGLLRRR